MFVALSIEKYDTAIVEVEGGARTAVSLNGMPGLPVAVDAFYDDDRQLLAIGIELG